MIKHTIKLCLCIFLITVISCERKASTPVSPWVNMLDADMSKWEKFIGVPHYTVPLDNVPKGDGMNGTPLGLNNDPLQVFKIELDNNKPVLHISGQIYGGLTTKQEYRNYHLKMEFKWGEQKYEPRLNQKRDNGILYHAHGEHGAFWNVWMLSQEFQVQEGDIGDYFAIGSYSDIHADYRTEDGETAWIYDKDAPLEPFTQQGNRYRCRRSVNNELEHGAWNTLELICFEDKSIHIVNGKVVLVLNNSRMLDGNNTTVKLDAGKVQIQSEGAEAYYRNMFIKEINEIPEMYRGYIK